MFREASEASKAEISDSLRGADVARVPMGMVNIEGQNTGYAISMFGNGNQHQDYQF